MSDDPKLDKYGFRVLLTPRNMDSPEFSIHSPNHRGHVRQSTPLIPGTSTPPDLDQSAISHDSSCVGFSFHNRDDSIAICSCHRPSAEMRRFDSPGKGIISAKRSDLRRKILKKNLAAVLRENQKPPIFRFDPPSDTDTSLLSKVHCRLTHPIRIRTGQDVLLSQVNRTIQIRFSTLVFSDDVHPDQELAQSSHLHRTTPLILENVKNEQHEDNMLAVYFAEKCMAFERTITIHKPRSADYGNTESKEHHANIAKADLRGDTKKSSISNADLSLLSFSSTERSSKLFAKDDKITVFFNNGSSAKVPEDKIFTLSDTLKEENSDNVNFSEEVNIFKDRFSVQMNVNIPMIGSDGVSLWDKDINVKMVHQRMYRADEGHGDGSLIALEKETKHVALDEEGPEDDNVFSDGSEDVSSSGRTARSRSTSRNRKNGTSRSRSRSKSKSRNKSRSKSRSKPRSKARSKSTSTSKSSKKAARRGRKISRPTSKSRKSSSSRSRSTRNPARSRSRSGSRGKRGAPRRSRRSRRSTPNRSSYQSRSPPPPYRSPSVLNGSHSPRRVSFMDEHPLPVSMANRGGEKMALLMTPSGVVPLKDNSVRLGSALKSPVHQNKNTTNNCSTPETPNQGSGRGRSTSIDSIQKIVDEFRGSMLTPPSSEIRRRAIVDPEDHHEDCHEATIASRVDEGDSRRMCDGSAHDGNNSTDIAEEFRDGGKSPMSEQSTRMDEYETPRADVKDISNEFRLPPRYTPRKGRRSTDFPVAKSNRNSSGVSGHLPTCDIVLYEDKLCTCGGSAARKRRSGQSRTPQKYSTPRSPVSSNVTTAVALSSPNRYNQTSSPCRKRSCTPPPLKKQLSTGPPVTLHTALTSTPLDNSAVQEKIVSPNQRNTGSPQQSNDAGSQWSRKDDSCITLDPNAKPQIPVAKDSLVAGMNTPLTAIETTPQKSPDVNRVFQVNPPLASIDQPNKPEKRQLEPFNGQMPDPPQPPSGKRKADESAEISDPKRPANATPPPTPLPELAKANSSVVRVLSNDLIMTLEENPDKSLPERKHTQMISLHALINDDMFELQSNFHLVQYSNDPSPPTFVPVRFTANDKIVWQSADATKIFSENVEADNAQKNVNVEVKTKTETVTVEQPSTIPPVNHMHPAQANDGATAETLQKTVTNEPPNLPSKSPESPSPSTPSESPKSPDAAMGSPSASPAPSSPGLDTAPPDLIFGTQQMQSVPFVLKCGKRAQCLVKMTNPADHSVAWNVEASNGFKLTAEPVHGILEKNSSVVIAIAVDLIEADPEAPPEEPLLFTWINTPRESQSDPYDEDWFSRNGIHTKKKKMNVDLNV